jgi:hypothetical protein
MTRTATERSGAPHSSSRRQTLAALGGGLVLSVLGTPWARAASGARMVMAARHFLAHRLPRRGARGRRRRLVHRAAQRASRLVRSQDRQERTDRTRSQFVAARPGAGAGPCRVAHRRGLNAIVRVGWPDRAVHAFALPPSTGDANRNTCAFDRSGDLWFKGQSGLVGRLEVRTGTLSVKEEWPTRPATSADRCRRASRGRADRVCW